MSTLKIITEITKVITAKEGKLFLTFEVEDGKVTHVESNLHYDKPLEEWLFYSKAIKRLLLEIGGRIHAWKRYKK